MVQSHHAQPSNCTRWLKIKYPTRQYAISLQYVADLPTRRRGRLRSMRLNHRYSIIASFFNNSSLQATALPIYCGPENILVSVRPAKMWNSLFVFQVRHFPGPAFLVMHFPVPHFQRPRLRQIFLPMPLADVNQPEAIRRFDQSSYDSHLSALLSRPINGLQNEIKCACF